MPINQAFSAKAWASSEYHPTWGARYAIDGKVPKFENASDHGQAWACNGASSGHKVEFTLEWPEPVKVAEVIYWGRTGSLPSESFKDYELYLDDDTKPTVTGTFKMVRNAQRVVIAPKMVSKIRLKFLNSHNAQNAGSSEIAVYSQKQNGREVKILWDAKEGKITNIASANEFLHNEPRKGWEI